MRLHKEFNRMISSAREGLAADYSTDTLPYRHASAMVVHCEKLHTAYTLLQKTCMPKNDSSDSLASSVSSDRPPA